jgi:ectoine hydroxylase-related dioxygenase (phytanoyl-CoA dioxygenase family)
LEQLVAVRVHLEENTSQNGPLVVVPGSHRQAVVNSQRVPCHVQSGGALVMRPFLLHASSKVKSGARRVLHFVFGPRALSGGQEWAHAV